MDTDAKSGKIVFKVILLISTKSKHHSVQSYSSAPIDAVHKT